MSGIGGSVEQMTQGHLRNVQQLAVFTLVIIFMQ